MIPASLMSHLFHFVHSGRLRTSPPFSSFPLQKDWLHTNCFFLLLLVSGRAMCYLTKNNNEGDGKCNLIPLIQLPLSPPVTGKQEAITVQRWHSFQTRGKREISASLLSGTYQDASSPHPRLLFFSFSTLINDIDSLWQLFVIIGKLQQYDWMLRFSYRRSHSKINFLAPGCFTSL